MYKRIIKKYKERKILRDMFLASFGISVFCFLIAFAIGFNSFQKVSVQKSINDEENKLSTCLIAIDNYISSAQDTLQILNSNVYINRLLINENSSWNDQMSIAANQIVNTIAANKRLHSIFIFGTDHIILKSSNSSYPILLSQEEEFMSYFQSSQLKTYNLYEYTDVFGETQRILSLTTGELSKDSSSYVKGVMVSIDIGAIGDEVYPDITENENYVLIDSNLNILGSKGEAYPFASSAEGDYIINKVLKDGLSSNTLIITDEAHEKYLVNYKRSKLNNYYLVHVLPYNTMLAPIHHTEIIVSIIGVVMLVLIFAITFFLSMWVYHPIDEVVNSTITLNHKKPADTETKVYKTELATVAQSITAMIQQLNQYHEKDEQIEIKQYLCSPYSNASIPACLQEWYGGNPSIENQVICLRICDSKDFISNNTSEAVIFQLQTISNMAAQEMLSLGEPVTAIIDNEYIAILLFSKDIPYSTEMLCDKTMSLLSAINEVLSVKMDAGISEKRKELKELKQAYHSAKAAIHYSFIYGMNSIITEKQMQTYALSGSTSFDSGLIMEAVREENYEAFIDQYHKMIQHLHGHSLQNAYETLISLAFEMTQYLKNISRYTMGIDISDLETIRQNIIGFQYVDEAMTWFLDLFGSISATIRSIQKNGTTDIVNNAVQYLEENYMDMSLSAQLLADKFNITPSYFSRIFNETIHCAFPDYLTGIRMEKAKEMLALEPSKSIQDICEAVGYTSSSYFTAQFKKKYGITPSQFRKAAGVV